MHRQFKHVVRDTTLRLLCLLLAACAVHVPGLARAQEVSAPNDDRATSYILAPNDLIEIKVFQEDDLESKLRVSRNGTITFPLVGQLSVGGKTPQQAARTIRDALARGYLINPQVSVNVLSFTKYRVTILGQVQKPGTYDFPDREKLTLLEAIGLAGGYTRGADPGRVVIKRGSGGEESVFRVNAKAMASDGRGSFEILPGDIVTVAESRF